MDSGLHSFILGIVAIVLAIISLKVFFTLWGILDRKWDPGKVGSTPETAFKDLKKKTVRVSLRDGTVIDEAKYAKTLYFNNSEIALNTTVFFQLIKPDQSLLFISGSDIVLIEEQSGQPARPS